MPDIIGIVKGYRMTRGGFGEQYWTITDDDGTDHTFAMWMDYRDPMWSKAGERVRVKDKGERRTYTGGGGYISIPRTGEIVEKLS